MDNPFPKNLETQTATSHVKDHKHFQPFLVFQAFLSGWDWETRSHAVFFPPSTRSAVHGGPSSPEASVFGYVAQSGVWLGGR